MAEVKTFDNLNPPATVTNPNGVLSRDFPAHVHHEDGSYVTVHTAEEKQAYLDQGYTEQPTHPQWCDHGAPKAVVPPAPKPPKAKAPKTS